MVENDHDATTAAALEVSLHFTAIIYNFNYPRKLALVCNGCTVSTGIYRGNLAI